MMRSLLVLVILLFLQGGNAVQITTVSTVLGGITKAATTFLEKLTKTKTKTRRRGNLICPPGFGPGAAPCHCSCPKGSNVIVPIALPAAPLMPLPAPILPVLPALVPPPPAPNPVLNPELPSPPPAVLAPLPPLGDLPAIPDKYKDAPAPSIPTLPPVIKGWGPGLVPPDPVPYNYEVELMNRITEHQNKTDAKYNEFFKAGKDMFAKVIKYKQYQACEMQYQQLVAAILAAAPAGAPGGAGMAMSPAGAAPAAAMGMPGYGPYVPPNPCKRPDNLDIIGVPDLPALAPAGSPAADLLGTNTPGMAPPGMAGMAPPAMMGMPGMSPPMMGAPGMSPPGMAPPGMAPPAMMGMPGMSPPMMGAPGMSPPGMAPPGMAPPAMMGAPPGMPPPTMMMGSSGMAPPGMAPPGMMPGMGLPGMMGPPGMGPPMMPGMGQPAMMGGMGPPSMMGGMGPPGMMPGMGPPGMMPGMQMPGMMPSMLGLSQENQTAIQANSAGDDDHDSEKADDNEASTAEKGVPKKELSISRPQAVDLLAEKQTRHLRASNSKASLIQERKEAYMGCECQDY
eukprot:TRINITY_DN10810_c0_g1_i1.p1 TRINITY_DN10810_c0_g1~~TRINITY_DN10810_c0_g1_i1.p1  ORF type:complete len:564 (+),score=147.43 TRINITY_DN10810_c0_g1_i1:172-1863(+)